MNEEELQEFKDIFNLFDTDGSGVIDSEEISKVVNNQDMEHRNPVLFELVNHLSTVQGDIDFETFLEAICEKVGNVRTRDGIQRLFELYDTEGNGHIDFHSFKRVARELGESLNDDELKNMMHHASVLNKTSSNEYFTPEDFYLVITRDRSIRR